MLPTLDLMNSRDLINAGRMSKISSVWRLLDLTAPKLMKIFQMQLPDNPRLRHPPLLCS